MLTCGFYGLAEGTGGRHNVNADGAAPRTARAGHPLMQLGLSNAASRIVVARRTGPNRRFYQRGPIEAARR
ncbi:hypothetical protein BN2476_240107 [Paraburkholderia piptadeniae]|uniref:Uncharacterized protein n=1 Tax=Paraburkholderia piptadeniae TaxID=1701573 RepID=A0A1N7RYZ5_9BURK|nr:hypothetical protein BN2476_240107 [Paraburkholderia piptadeniae]